MLSDNYWQNIYTVLNQLESSKETFFSQVWGNKRLQYEDGVIRVDEVDMHSAQLVCSAQRQQKPLLLVLPDEMPHRIPVLFVTLLLRHAFNHVNSHGESQNVVYFGLMASIRDHLSKTYCSGVCLNEIFNQIDLKKTSTSNIPRQDYQNSLPSVIFSNMPTNPGNILDTYLPAWCFIDLGNGERLKWFPSCLAMLQQKQIPTVACIQNPLSDAIQQSEDANWQVFRWPYTTYNKTNNSDVLVQPLVLKGDAVEAHSEQYQRIYKRLFKQSKSADGKFASDSLKVVRQYARSLEQLNVPYDLYESECQRFYGIYSLSDSQKTAQHFVKILQNDNSPLGDSLNSACEALNQIRQQLQSMKDPPLWKTLCNLCLPELEDDRVRLLVFPSESRKKLFALALLAYHDFSTEDLASISVYLVSLRQLSQWQRMREIRHLSAEADGNNMPPIEKQWHPLLVGVPYHDTKYAALLRCGLLDVLVYQHQTNALQYTINQWNKAIENEHPDNIKALSAFNPRIEPPSVRDSHCATQRVFITTPRQWLVEESEDVILPDVKELFRIPNRDDEIAWLMHAGDNVSAEEHVLLGQTPEKTQIEAYNAMTTDRITNIIFHEGFHVRFPQDAKVQVVLKADTDRHLDERSVRSLRINDVVMFIHGQNRQNLYELIMSRVHSQPSIALYVDLIQKWQEEMAEGASRYNLGPKEILNRMQQQGSRLQTSQAIKFWIDGQVLSPNDPSDLQRVAEILKMSFTQQYYQEITHAASRLHGIHITLSRRLNQWLQQDAVATSPEKIDDFIDPKLGITFNDFHDALQLLTVKEIKQEHGIFIISDLGQLSKE